MTETKVLHITTSESRRLMADSQKKIMPNVYEGDLIGEGLSFGIVVSRFNSFVTEKLLAGALDALKRHGIDPDAVDVFWTPGCF